MISLKHIFFFSMVTLAFSCKHFTEQEEDIKAGVFAKEAYVPGAQVLDVRTIGEFRSGHLKGAMQADWLNITQFAERTAYLDKNNPLFIYCMSGNRGKDAADYLRNNGFTNVKNLDGGLVAWKSDGKKLVECKPHGEETTRESYEKIVASAPLVIVDFAAPWSPPSKKMEPVLKEFVQIYGNDIKLVTMDGSTESRLMQALSVNALPTYILYSNGLESSRRGGVLSKEELEEWVSSVNQTEYREQSKLGGLVKKRN